MEGNFNHQTSNIKEKSEHEAGPLELTGQRERPGGIYGKKDRTSG
jgi:hypothetical protein